ncbi:hypothetical protein QYE76_056591 [Lolium multiflorum]|uniref:Uncharacterized protein n=1 Tax=Lolium multiflorum TaxID=4521 RepID=A0AAD8T2E6_LOLMU|nr:hypothetical protein QYE76_056591 [Lolium multiflorum]
MAESSNANAMVSGLKIPNLPPLATCTFPDTNGRQIRCTSYGQALYSLPGSKLTSKGASEWFKTFYQGLDDPLFFPYTESENFENPVSFRLDSFADDADTRQLYSIMIHPCFLPVGMSTSNRIIKPGYESYQPVVAARQFGLGQVSPHFFLHHLTESRADLPDVLTSQRGYSFFDALAIPIPHNLSFTSSTDGFETWWTMWKTHAFRRALGPLLKQLDAEYDIPAEQTDDTSSGEVEEVLMPSATLDLATPKSVANEVATLAEPAAETQEPIASSSAVPLVLGEGCDLSSLLTFDPESIEPATKASEEPGPSATHSQLQQLRALLSSSIETLVENPEEVKSLLEEIQPHLPRISLSHAQLPLKADIANKCRRLNEKKASLDAKTDTSASTAELEALRKELEVLEERVRVTKQLIQDKEALIAHSREEAEGLQAELKTDLAGIRALNKQLVTGQDEDDEAEIAEVDRVRVNGLHALDVFLQ